MQKHNATISNLRTAAIISFIAVLPFAILDLTFNGRNVTDLAVLFGLLWLLAFAFIAITMPIVQNIRAGRSVLAKPYYSFAQSRCFGVYCFNVGQHCC